MRWTLWCMDEVGGGGRCDIAQLIDRLTVSAVVCRGGCLEYRRPREKLDWILSFDLDRLAHQGSRMWMAMGMGRVKRRWRGQSSIANGVKFPSRFVFSGKDQSRLKVYAGV
jgi:hypothetical protein